ncbi:MAG: hypothetical protein ACLTMP_00675 [Eggerthella lenta]
MLDFYTNMIDGCAVRNSTCWEHDVHPSRFCAHRRMRERWCGAG